MIENQQIYQVLFPFYENYLAMKINAFTISDKSIQDVVKAALDKGLIAQQDQSFEYHFTEQGLKFMASQDNSWDAF